VVAAFQASRRPQSQAASTPAASVFVTTETAALARVFDHAINVVVLGLPREVLRDGATIFRASTGAIVVLKDEVWPCSSGRGAIHRSSPASSSVAPHLVLTLDVLE
jgi:hypothetical protein